MNDSLARELVTTNLLSSPLRSPQRLQVERAAKVEARRARAAAKRSEGESERKRRCLLYEKTHRCGEVDSMPLVSPPERLHKVAVQSAVSAVARVGDHVRVDQDLTTGKHSHGGGGYVVGVRGKGSETTVDLRYHAVDGGRIEKDIPPKRITRTPIPQHSGRRKKRRRRRPLDSSPIPTPTLYPSPKLMSWMHCVLVTLAILERVGGERHSCATIVAASMRS